MSFFFPALSVPGGPPPTRRSRFAVVAAVAVAHAVLLALLLTLVPAERLAEIARPLTVRMIDLTPEAPPPPPPPPPKRPTEKALPQPPLPVMAIATPPSQPVEAPAFVVPAQLPPPAVPPAPISVAAPVAETPVRFDASYLNNPKPAYPAISRRMNETGKVVLRVHVGTDGRPTEVEIKTSSGFARLDNSAREAVSQWRFVPARRGEEAIAAWVLVPIVFSLEG